MTDSKSPVLVMLCGAPTSGKTTYTIKHEFDKSDYVLISSDYWIEHAARTLSSTYDNVFDSQIKWAIQQMEYFLGIATSSNMNILWDQTNLTPKTRKQKLTKIPKHYKKVAVYFQSTQEELMIRNQQRIGKIIPPHILLNMNKSFVIPSIEEGFDEVYDGNA